MKLLSAHYLVCSCLDMWCPTNSWSAMKGKPWLYRKKEKISLSEPWKFPCCVLGVRRRGCKHLHYTAKIHAQIFQVQRKATAHLTFSPSLLGFPSPFFASSLPHCFDTHTLTHPWSLICNRRLLHLNVFDVAWLCSNEVSDPNPLDRSTWAYRCNGPPRASCCQLRFVVFSHNGEGYAHVAPLPI